MLGIIILGLSCTAYFFKDKFQLMESTEKGKTEDSVSDIFRTLDEKFKKWMK
jgi:hypothetical protein